MRLEETFFPLLIALGTNAMSRVSLCHASLQRSRERSASVVGQLVPLLLSRPCFELNNLFFHLTYFLQQILLRKLGRECALLGGYDLSRKFEGLGLKAGGVLDVHHGLCQVASRLER